MPTKPTKTISTQDTAAILNGIRNAAGAEYASMVPAAYKPGDVIEGKTITTEQALERLRQIGSAVMDYAPAQNAFITTLTNRINRVILSSRLYDNPWRFFKKGYLEYGETIEEIFVNLAKSFQFDPETAEQTVFKRVIPDVRSAFHTRNYQKFYKVTTSDVELRAAFLSFTGVNDFISKIIESMYTSANYDELIMMKYMIQWNILHGRLYPLQIPAITAETSNEVVVELKNISELVTFMSSDYNFAGVPTYTDKNYQYFILNTRMLATIDVETLARAFNLDKVTLMGHTVAVDSFTFNNTEEQRALRLLYPDSATRPDALWTEEQLAILDSIPGIMVDMNWFMIFDNYQNMESIRNPEGQYWNHFLHVWKTFSTSPFNTAIAFTTEASTVTGITITPATATMTKGTSMPFTATVATTGLAAQGVTWSVNSTLSSINQNGTLTVGAKETAATLTVTAISNFDTSVQATATVTVSGNTGSTSEGGAGDTSDTPSTPVEDTNKDS